MKCLTWNTQWAPPKKLRGRLLSGIIRNLGADVVCYTEVLKGLVPEGHNLEADADYGYRHNGTRRKVLLWSREPWDQIDSVGDPDMPAGRFASGVVQGIRFVGVCIPWRDAHVKTGRKDRKPWEDHIRYCEALERVLQRYESEPEPICVLGDFNQRVPRLYQPPQVFASLAKAIPKSWQLITQGVTTPEGKQLIDHIALSPGLKGSNLEVLPRFSKDGTRLSDHVGVITTLSGH